jgi:hypothetical protein
MKFVSLRTERTHRRGKLGKSSRTARESLTKSLAAPHQIHTYAELRKQIHDDLRVQHPEWVEMDGTSPMCDSYEARLLELLDPLMRRRPTSLSANQKRKDSSTVYSTVGQNLAAKLRNSATHVANTTC